MVKELMKTDKMRSDTELSASLAKKLIAVLMAVMMFVCFDASVLAADNADEGDLPQPQGEAALLIDADSGKIMYEKNK